MIILFIVIVVMVVVLGISFGIAWVMVLSEENNEMKQKWRNPPDGGKIIIVAFNDFHKYYMLNPTKYNIKEFSHPVREGKYVFQFPTSRDYKKYVYWRENNSDMEENHYYQEEFSEIIQKDLDEIQEKHIKWLEDRKKEFEEQRSKLI